MKSKHKLEKTIKILLKFKQPFTTVQNTRTWTVTNFKTHKA